MTQNGTKNVCHKTSQMTQSKKCCRNVTKYLVEHLKKEIFFGGADAHCGMTDQKKAQTSNMRISVQLCQLIANDPHVFSSWQKLFWPVQQQLEHPTLYRRIFEEEFKVALKHK
jgi:hypothetical protein